jgi:hypothetical protein
MPVGFRTCSTRAERLRRGGGNIGAAAQQPGLSDPGGLRSPSRIAPACPERSRRVAHGSLRAAACPVQESGSGGPQPLESVV